MPAFFRFGSGFGSSSSLASTNDVSLSYITGLPDPNMISSPQLVVMFKNFIKRDSTTRDKALTEFISLISDDSIASELIDGNVHWCWALMYPKLAIDTSRNVRILTHKAQGIIYKILGKKSSKYLKDSIGPWLTGLYDTDKSVSNAAETALELVFPTKEKRDTLYSIFQKPLLEYIENVVNIESTNTLSDERFISKEEAEGKYNRVLRSNIGLLTDIINREPKSVDENNQLIVKILENTNLYKSAYSSDSLLAKSTLQLVSTLINQCPDIAQQFLTQISTSLIIKGLSSSTPPIFIDLLQTIIVLTRKFPHSWSVAKFKTKSAYDVLLGFIRHGSQRSGKYYWPSILALLSSLPSTISPYSDQSPAGTTIETAEAIKEGITKEMVVQLGTGWGAYLTVIEKIVSGDTTKAVSRTVLKNSIKLIVDTFIMQEGDVLDRDILMIVGKKLADLYGLEPEIMTESFEVILEDITLQKKNKSFLKKLLFCLRVWLDHINGDATRSVLGIFEGYLSKAFQCLNSDSTTTTTAADDDDEFRLYSASAILVTFDESIFAYDPSIVDQLGKFLQEHLSSHIVSEAAPDVVQILRLYAIHNHSEDANKIVQKSVELAFNSIVRLSDLDKRSSLFPLILREYAIFKNRTRPIPLASEYLLSVYSSIDSWEITNDWDSILFGICSHGIFVSEDVAHDLLKGISGLQLIKGKNVDKAVYTFSNLIKLDRTYFMEFIETEHGKQLVSQLWKLAESHPEAEGILNAIEDSATIPNDNSASSKSNKTLDSLTDGLLSEIERSSVDAIDISVQRGQRLLDQTHDPEAKLQLFEKLLFYTSGTWKYKLTMLFENQVSASLAVSNPLGSALAFVKSLTEDSKMLQIVPDELICMSMFTISLIMNNRELFDQLLQPVQLQLISSLSLISEVSTDHVFLAVSDFDNDEQSFLNDAILAFNKDVSFILLEKIKEFKLSRIIQSTGEPKVCDSLGCELVQTFWNNSISQDAKGYYSARVLKFIVQNTLERDSASVSEIETLFSKFRPQFSQSNLGLSAIFAGFEKLVMLLPSFDRLRNQFASELISVRGENILPDKFKSLILLNMLLNVPDYEFDELKTEIIPLNRLSMCLTSLFACCRSEYAYSPDFLPAQVEITRLLSKVLPLYADSISKSIWESSVEVLEHNFASLDNESAVLEYFSLKYFNILVKLQENVADLSEVWLEKESGLYAELLDTLFRASASHSQAKELSNIQLLRAVSTTPLKYIDEPENLFTTLAVPSVEIQRAGFTILHQLIPQQQEEKSIELQLQQQKLGEIDDDDDDNDNDDNKLFDLPPELVSLLLDIPVRGAPTYDLSRYLWSWVLIYDHFDRATFDLRKIYIEELKEDGHLEVLMNFISERIVSGDLQSTLVEHGAGFEDIIQKYGSEVYDSVTEEIDGLMIHLYYLGLQYTGSLVKSWFVNLKKRQTSLAVEKFTEKFITPTIVNDELDKVDLMLKNHDGLIDDSMNAKISRTLKEVNAYYTIDDQTMEIAIRMPVLYPLRDIQVEGVKRIGVRERQWRAWLLASQAIGSSQNGTIVDTLELFKRNVSLHFEGVAECAICYSILHQDHSLPTKTCTTCKNKFHANCLYKWFKSASASTCPLCRSNFSFRIGL